MSYNSIIQAIQGKVECEIENEILKAVRRCDIHVDKDELVKALKYDRDQYNQGYEDAKEKYEKAMEKVIDELIMAIDTCSGLPCADECQLEVGDYIGCKYCVNKIKEWGLKK